MYMRGFVGCRALRVRGRGKKKHAMTDEPIKLLDVVALTVEKRYKGLVRGQVGTVVEQLAPRVFEVEFDDDEGRTYAMEPIRAGDLLVLRYRPLKVG